MFYAYSKSLLYVFELSIHIYEYDYELFYLTPSCNYFYLECNILL